MNEPTEGFSQHLLFCHLGNPVLELSDLMASHKGMFISSFYGFTRQLGSSLLLWNGGLSIRNASNSIDSKQTRKQIFHNLENTVVLSFNLVGLCEGPGARSVPIHKPNLQRGQTAGHWTVQRLLTRVQEQGHPMEGLTATTGALCPAEHSLLSPAFPFLTAQEFISYCLGIF